MNEAGLVIELMRLEGVRYPAPDARPAVDVLQWIQYNLDSPATVAPRALHPPDQPRPSARGREKAPFLASTPVAEFERWAAYLEAIVCQR